jgi:NitT/TauT family transport system ATP-binding protein
VSITLEARDATLGYDGVPVVQGLDLTISAGEVVCILGASGCGKSTLLRALAGLQPVAGGQLLADGEDVRGPSRERALVFQDDALLPWRSVRRNVELPLALRKVPRSRRREVTTEWLDRVGLGPAAGRLPRELSGGMRQRAQLARSLAGQPGAILMDEPFGALDAQSRSRMQEVLVQALGGTSATVVFVTHDVDEALALGDRVVVLGSAGVESELRVPRPRDFSAAPAAADRDLLLDALGVTRHRAHETAVA